MRTLTRKTLFTIVAGLAINFLWLVFSSTPTFAASVDSLLPKVHFEGLYTCYEGGFLKSNLGSLSNYQDPFQSLINTNKNSSVPLITGHAGANSVKCSELVFGKDYDSWSYWHDGEVLDGIFPNYPVGYSSIGSGTVESPESEQKAFLKKVGYEEKSETMENGQCVRFRFTKNNSLYVESNPWDIPDDVLVYSSKICAELNSSGGVVPNSITIENNTTDDFIVFSLHDNSGGKFDSDYDAPYAIRMTYNAQGTLFGDDTATCFFYDYSSFDNIINYFLETITESGDFLTQREFSLSTTWYYLVVADPVEKTTTTTRNETYSFSNSTTAATTAMKNANSAYTTYGNLAFKPAEEFSLYTYYLNDFYKVTSVCDPDSHVQSAMGDNWVKVQLYDAGTSAINSNCYVEKPSNASTKVTGLNSSKHFGTEMDFNGVVTALNAIDPSTITEEDLSALPTVTPEGTPDDSGGDDAVDEDPCYAEAGVLGWIMCPVVRMLDENMTEIYGWVENNFLSTRADIFADDAYGIKTTWGKFRDIANILLAIMMLIIVISQVTGFGVSNYGIKKMLPRIIITAVLINLSYIVCVLAIDLSNILGYRLKELLENLVVVNNSVAPGGTGSGFVIGSLAIIGATVAVILNPAILITLLLFLLSGLISVLFLWILLVTRQAGIILGVILSPVALACYMLPNTQNFFKRYTKMMQGLLMLYPICGLVVGGGIFASKVMVNVGAGLNNDTGQSAFMLAGMALQVLPFFFIPTLLKGSFSAIGNIGAKISSLGSRVGGGTTRGIRNMDAVKDAQRRGMERKMRLRAGLDKEGNVAKGRLARLASIGPGRNRRRAAASSAIDKNYAINRYGDASFLAAQAATRETTQQENEVKAQEALVKNMRDSSGLGKLLDNTGEMETAYRNALLGLDEQGNAVTDAKIRSARIKAYQNLLSAKGDDGRQAVHRAVTDAQNGVAIGGVTHRASDEALRTHASNLVNKHGGAYKADSRSTFNHANGILGGSAQAMATYENDYASLVNSVKDETLGSMDDAEFGRLCSAVQADPTGSAAQSLADAAYAALQNDAAMAGVKAGRKNELQLLAANSTQQQQIDADAVADAAAQQAAATAEVARIAREDQQFQVHQASTREQIYAQHEHNIQSAGRLTQDQNFGTSIVGPQPVIRAGEYMPPAIFDPSKAQISGGIVTTGNPTGERWIVQGEHRFNLRTGQFDRNYTPPTPPTPPAPNP